VATESGRTFDGRVARAGVITDCCRAKARRIDERDSAAVADQPDDQQNNDDRDHDDPDDVEIV
jgi:hypothetical protein